MEIHGYYIVMSVFILPFDRCYEHLHICHRLVHCTKWYKENKFGIWKNKSHQCGHFQLYICFWSLDGLRNRLIHQQITNHKRLPFQVLEFWSWDANLVRSQIKYSSSLLSHQVGPLATSHVVICWDGLGMVSSA